MLNAKNFFVLKRLYQHPDALGLSGFVAFLMPVSLSEINDEIRHEAESLSILLVTDCSCVHGGKSLIVFPVPVLLW